MQLVNTARAVPRTCGGTRYQAAPPVVWNDRIARAARLHALDLAIHGGVGHQGSDGSTLLQRVDRVGYRWANVGENVAGGQATSEEVVAAWLGSSGHCAIIMTADFTEAGAAWGRGPGRYRIYWALVMARPR